MIKDADFVAPKVIVFPIIPPKRCRPKESLSKTFVLKNLKPKKKVCPY